MVSILISSSSSQLTSMSHSVSSCSVLDSIQHSIHYSSLMCNTIIHYTVIINAIINQTTDLTVDDVDTIDIDSLDYCKHMLPII